MKIAGIEVRSTKELFNKETRFCNLVYSDAKQGKTTLAGSLNKFTLKYRGKPSLFLAFEASDGGGTATVQDLDIDYVIPKNKDELRGVIDYLQTDTKYGGVIGDNLTDMVKSIILPYALKFPSKEKAEVRVMGVPDRGDYQSMGVFLQQMLAPLVNLTRHDNLNIRKDLVLCALSKDKMSADGKVLIAVQPALPGAMATDAPAMVQTVSRITTKVKVVPNPKDPKTTTRLYQRVMVNDSDGIVVAGDRWKVMPQELVITDDNGNALGFSEIYEQFWMPKLKGEGHVE